MLPLEQCSMAAPDGTEKAKNTNIKRIKIFLFINPPFLAIRYCLDFDKSIEYKVNDFDDFNHVPWESFNCKVAKK
jgi:hypothetical protein